MIAIGSDHAWFHLKQEVIKHLEARGIAYQDFGTYTADSCHYVTFAEKVAHAVADQSCEKGILICGTGVGMSMAANKVKGIRAACCSDHFSAKATRQHNNANILCFGERVVGAGVANELVDLFLDTPYEGGRHQIRVDMISELEK